MIEVQEFRAEVRQWLADNLVGEYAALKGLGGPGREHEAFDERRAWNQHLAAAGLTCLGWPEEHGGRGLTVAHRVAFYEEYALANAPDKVNHLGEELVGPTLIAYGTPEQQQRFLPKILDVTELWSQGYSEPGAGSDLANVSTTAELDGEHWVVNGQKVWTSLAHWAQWCFVIARSEKGSKRHAGLSYLLIPLDQPGVEIRPIIQLTGDSEFNEVFFDDARTDADLVVGEPGDGWRVAMGTLTFERGVSTLGQQIRYARELSGIVELAKKTGAVDDPVIREKLTRSWVGLKTHAVVRDGDHGRRASRAGLRVEVVVGQLASRTRRDRDGRPGQGRTAARRRRIRRVAAAVPLLPLGHHLRRFQRNPAQHHRRASARPAPRGKG